jgi:hypothetical protein
MISKRQPFGPSCVKSIQEIWTSSSK